ncbi:MAG: hypothetical protein J6A79_05650 [Clostridia bacterium]|nr:hypothetical protein [Clostridia bacterium]
MYALNLDTDGRILSATYDEFAPPEYPRTDHLPDGDLSGYFFRDGEFIPDMHTIFVRTDAENRILEIRNEKTLEQASFYVGGNPWKKLDEGCGWRYSEPESYLDSGLINDQGIPLYRVSGRRVVRRTDEEIAADAKAAGLDITQEQRIEALEEALAEMAAMLAAIRGGMS